MRISLRDFLDQVNAIERIIDLRDELVQFGLEPPGGLTSTALGFRSLVRQIGQSGLQPSLDGSVLLLAAAFEQFISDVMVDYAATLPLVFPGYRDLPNAVRSSNERMTGEALSRRRSRFEEYERQRFVQNLRGCHSGVVPYVLNGEAIAINERNLTVTMFNELFTRLGIKDIWDVISSAQYLENWSGPGGPSIAVPRAKNLLNELTGNRNKVAHRVGATSLGPQIIRSYAEFERALAQSLVEGLENHLASL